MSAVKPRLRKREFANDWMCYSARPPIVANGLDAQVAYLHWWHKYVETAQVLTCFDELTAKKDKA